MFAFEPELAIAVMNEKQIGFFPASNRVTFHTIGRSCVFVRIAMTIRASSKVQADVLGAFLSAIGIIAKVALVTW